MRPVIAIVGRPNVGKSTLYNRLTNSRDALVDDYPGVTRDRLVGCGRTGSRFFWVVDTSGITGGQGGLHELLQEQVDFALAEADAIVFLVDGREGLNAADRDIAGMLRSHHKPLFLAVNKMEGKDADIDAVEYYELGMGSPQLISARRGSGVTRLIEMILDQAGGSGPEESKQSIPHVAIVGRPNVGKSTLANALVGMPRVVVCESPGTTRDSVRIPLQWQDRNYVLLDTAGMRRRPRVSERLEKYSAIKTLEALESGHVILLVVDAREGITEQDARLAGLTRSAGRSAVLVVNKWDRLEAARRRSVRNEIDRKLPFLDGVERVFVSAKFGSKLGDVMAAVARAYDSAVAQFSTPQLNTVLREAVTSVPPPMVGSRRIRMKYAHQGGTNPPLVVIHGNLVGRVPGAYRRYLSKRFRQRLNLVGTPVRIAFKTARNPYGTLKTAARH